MIVHLNGEPRELPAGITLAEVVRSLGRDPEGRGVAIALDGQVVPRARWHTETVPEAAKIEVVNAVGGG